MAQAFRQAGVTRAVMAGGIHRARAIFEARPDWGAVSLALRLHRFGDDAILRALAEYLQESGISIVAVTEYLPEVVAPVGHLAGPLLTAGQEKDVSLGAEVARLLGRADVGQTAVIKGGHVLALEAVEGTDETIRRGARLGGAGVVVVKVSKPGQDERFDLPAVGTKTLDVMRDCRASVLAIEGGRTLLLDAAQLFAEAERAGISVVGVSSHLHVGLSPTGGLKKN